MEGKTRCESGIKIHWHTSTIFLEMQQRKRFTQTYQDFVGD